MECLPDLLVGHAVEQPIPRIEGERSGRWWVASDLPITLHKDISPVPIHSYFVSNLPACPCLQKQHPHPHPLPLPPSFPPD
jgi:hypothetical protein